MELLSFLVSGVVQGLIYSLIALGIVLIYKGTKVLNFVQPLLALFTAFVCHFLAVKAGFLPFAKGSYPRFLIAAILSLLVVGLLGLALERDLMRRVEKAPKLVSLVATIAAAQGLVGLVILLFTRNESQASEFRTLPALIPGSWSIGSGQLVLTRGDIVVLVGVPLIGLGLTAFFRRSKLGIAIRASAENPDAATLLGVDVHSVTRFVWVAAAVLAGVAALLIVPVRGSFDVNSLSGAILVRAFAAALVGGLTSLPGAVVGGLIVGVSEFLVRWITPAPGAAEVWLFTLMFGAMVIRPILFGDREATAENVAFIPSLRELPRRLRMHPVSRATRRTFIAVALMLAVAASLATGPSTNSVLTQTVVYGIVGISLTVLIGYAGQISLGHYALVGVGAFSASILYETGPVPFVLLLPAVFAVGMVVSLVLGLPALRVRGPYLAILTVAFNVVCETWLFKQQFFGGGTGGRTLTLPDTFGLRSQTGRPLFVFSVIALLGCIWIADNLRRTRTGRGFFALRENEKAAQTLGIDLTRYRLLAFAVSGGMAAVAGTILGFSVGTVTADVFPTFYSFVFVSMVIIGGLGSLVGAVLGAFGIFGIPFLLKFIDEWFVLIGTAVVLINVLTRINGGIAGAIVRVRDPVVTTLVATEDTEDARV